MRLHLRTRCYATMCPRRCTAHSRLAPSHSTVARPMLTNIRLVRSAFCPRCSCCLARERRECACVLAFLGPCACAAGMCSGRTQAWLARSMVGPVRPRSPVQPPAERRAQISDCALLGMLCASCPCGYSQHPVSTHRCSRDHRCDRVRVARGASSSPARIR